MPLVRKLFWLVIISISLGYLESAVVVYLRKIYYPNGFIFPLVEFDNVILKTEMIRELSTIIILFGISNLFSNALYRKLASFLLCFGIWDISYYIFLKLLINWPKSFFSWDILFLFPVPWLGPVLAPIINSLTMLIFAFALFYYSQKKIMLNINFYELFLLAIGSIIVLCSFTLSYLKEFFNNGFDTHRNIYQNINQENMVTILVPENFSWIIFSIGELLILIGIILMIKRLRNLRRPYK